MFKMSKFIESKFVSINAIKLFIFFTKHLNYIKIFHYYIVKVKLIILCSVVR